MKKKIFYFEDIFEIVIEKESLKSFYDFIIKEKKKISTINGFEKGKAPLNLIKDHYNEKIKKEICEFFFYMDAKKKIIKFFSENGLTLPIVIDPTIEFDLENFELKYIQKIPNIRILKENFEGKKIKIPTRKKYKDLDKQAISILNKENENLSKFDLKINYEDWVKLQVYIYDEDKKKIFSDLSTFLWINVSSEKIDSEIYELFKDKKKNDEFFTDAVFLQNYFSKCKFIKYKFKVIIKEHVSASFFDFNKFAKFFEIKKQEDLLNKIIDVFSFKNDISLKREIAQLSFKKLFEYFKINFNEEIYSEYKNEIVKDLKKNPDYLIFQASKTFSDNLKIYTCQRLMEVSLMDFLSVRKEIKINESDLYFYFNILQRNRLKDFIYFDSFEIKNDNTVPIESELIEKIVLREKTLQFFIKQFEKIS